MNECESKQFFVVCCCPVVRVESNKSGLFFLKLKVVWFSEKTPKLKKMPRGNFETFDFGQIFVGF